MDKPKYMLLPPVVAAKLTDRNSLQKSPSGHGLRHCMIMRLVDDTTPVMSSLANVAFLGLL